MVAMQLCIACCHTLFDPSSGIVVDLQQHRPKDATTRPRATLGVCISQTQFLHILATHYPKVSNRSPPLERSWVSFLKCVENDVLGQPRKGRKVAVKALSNLQAKLDVNAS